MVMIKGLLSAQRHRQRLLVAIVDLYGLYARRQLALAVGSRECRDHVLARGQERLGERPADGPSGLFFLSVQSLARSGGEETYADYGYPLDLVGEALGLVLGVLGHLWECCISGLKFVLWW